MLQPLRLSLIHIFEAADAVENGADEVDMVINIGWVKDRRWGDLLEEIRAVKACLLYTSSSPLWPTTLRAERFKVD